MPVEVKGLDEVLKAMRQFEPDLAKSLNKQVRAALSPVQKKAQGYVPSEISGLSHWSFATKGKQINAETSAFAVTTAKGTRKFPKFNSGIVRSGIKIHIGKTRSNRSGFIAHYQISNISAAGAIYETAGRKNPGGQPWNRKSGSHNYSHSRNPNAGKHFIDSMGDSMQGEGKKRGRLIYRAYEEDKGKAITQTIRAVEMSIAVFKRRAQAQTLRIAA